MPFVNVRMKNKRIPAGILFVYVITCLILYRGGSLWNSQKSCKKSLTLTLGKRLY